MSNREYGSDFLEEILRRIDPVLTREQRRYLDRQFFDRKLSQLLPKSDGPERKREIAIAIDEKLRNGDVPKAAYSEVSDLYDLDPTVAHGPAEKYYKDYVRAIAVEAWTFWRANHGYRVATARHVCRKRKGELPGKN